MIPKESILKAFHVKEDQGLQNEAVNSLLEKYGLNQLEQKQTISPISLFLNQFKDFMVLVLLAATMISGLLGEYTDAITIIAIVVMNAILGFVQEFKAEKSLQALKDMAAPHARVIRNGEIESIPAVEVVPGDIVLLESGDRVPADIRLFETHALYIEESALTGESVPVSKQDEVIPYEDIPLGDQKNMAFMGTLITRGTGTGIIVETGMNTEMGKIADLIQSTEEVETPLQRRLEQLGKILIVISLILTALVVVTGIWHGHNAYAMFLAGVSLAVAAIPEGLPAIVTVALALGVQRMIKRKAIVRKLPSVETLGCATVICSDKTGTLTQNKMTVTDLWIGGEAVKVTGTGYEPDGEFLVRSNKLNPDRNIALRKLLEISALCNNAQLIEGTTEKRDFLNEKKANGEFKVIQQKGH